MIVLSKADGLSPPVLSKSAYHIHDPALIFIFAGMNLTPEYNVIGLLMLLGSVIMDAIAPNVQEKLMANESSDRTMMMTNLCALPTLAGFFFPSCVCRFSVYLASYLFI